MLVIKCFNEECRFFDLEEPDHCGRPLVEIQKCVDAIVKKVGRSQNWYARELASNGCLCGKPKKRGHSFCWSCFMALDRDQRRAMHQRIGQGYEEDFEEAVRYLEREVW